MDGSTEDLDFLSPKFDPAKVLALSPSKLQLPCPDVQPCDNLNMYAAVLQGKRKVYDGPKGGVATTKEAEQVELKGCVDVSTKEDQVGVIPKGPSRSHFFAKSVLEFMKRADTGPFQLLQACLESGAPLRVWVRHCMGVRGVCEGVLVAFDKHMNVVLSNVTECYTPFRTRGNGGVEWTGRRKKRKKKKAFESERDEHPLDTESTTRETDQIASEGCLVAMTTNRTRPSCIWTSEDESCTGFQSRRCVKKLFIQGSNVILISPVH